MIIYTNANGTKVQNYSLFWNISQIEEQLTNVICLYIYILYVIIYDKATILVAVHFSMQNNELSSDLGWGNVSICL